MSGEIEDVDTGDLTPWEVDTIGMALATLRRHGYRVTVVPPATDAVERAAEGMRYWWAIVILSGLFGVLLLLWIGMGLGSVKASAEFDRGYSVGMGDTMASSAAAVHDAIAARDLVLKKSGLCGYAKLACVGNRRAARHD